MILGWPMTSVLPRTSRHSGPLGGLGVPKRPARLRRRIVGFERSRQGPRSSRSGHRVCLSLAHDHQGSRRNNSSAPFLDLQAHYAPVLLVALGLPPQTCAYEASLGSSVRVGSSIWKVEPLPKVDSTQIRPPCISTICLAMASPRPVPPLALVREL